MKRMIVCIIGALILLLQSACEMPTDGPRETPGPETKAVKKETPPAAEKAAASVPDEAAPAPALPRKKRTYKVDFLGTDGVYDDRKNAPGKVVRARFSFYRRIGPTSVMVISLGRSYDLIFLSGPEDIASDLDRLEKGRNYEFTFRVEKFTNTGRIKGRLLDVETPEKKKKKGR